MKIRTLSPRGTQKLARIRPLGVVTDGVAILGARHPLVEGQNGFILNPSPRNTIPEFPAVIRVASLTCRYSPVGGKAEVLDGPLTILWGHGYDRGGKWVFGNGRSVQEYLELLTAKEIDIAAILVCNPRRESVAGDRIYTLGPASVNLEWTHGRLQLHATIGPGPGAQLVVPSGLG